MVLKLLLGTVTWILVTSFNYVAFWIGVIVNIIPAIVLLLTNRKKLSSLSESFSYFSAMPLGARVFSGIISMGAPYSASVSPRITELSVKDTIVKCSVTCEDYYWHRNPYNSVHAIALANIGELSSGLAAFTAMQALKGVKGIPVKIAMEYIKKGRGTLTSTSTVDTKSFTSESVVLESIITDFKGEIVAKCLATWQLKFGTDNEPELKKQKQR